MSLDSTLKAWAAKHEAPQAHLDKLAGQTVTEAARRRLSPVEPIRAWLPFLTGLGYAATGAMVAGLVFVFYLQVCGSRMSLDGALAAARLAVPTPGQVSAVSRLFSETARLFPQRLRWIAQSNGDMGLGVESVEEAWVADTPPTLVRLVVVSRAGKEEAWRPVWSADVVVRGEDLAEIAPNRSSANKLALWVYPLQNGMVAVDTVVELESPLRLASRQSAVFTAGEPVQTAAVCLGDAEYRLFQTVEPLNGRRDNGS